MATGGFSAAFGSFAVAATTLVALVFLAAFAVAGAEETLLDRARSRSTDVKHWAGWVVTAVGVWLLVLALFADFFAGILPG